MNKPANTIEAKLADELPLLEAELRSILRRASGVATKIHKLRRTSHGSSKAAERAAKYGKTKIREGRAS